MLLRYEGGYVADSTELDSTGTAIFTFLEGVFAGKKLYYHTEKDGCCTLSEELCCSSFWWKNKVEGCPKHSRPEEGSRVLRAFLKPACAAYETAKAANLLCPIVKKEEVELQPS